MRSTCSQALATTLVGSSSTPSLSKRRVELDREIMLDAELLGAIAVALLDAALGILSVAAHVPFAGGACRTGHRIGPAHDADHEIAGRKAASGRRLFDTAEQFMADDETLPPPTAPSHSHL